MSSCPEKPPTGFAARPGIEQVANDFFILPERRRQLDEALRRRRLDDQIKYGTIGAVAVDVAGHVAAATSTGGITAKRWGRVGDSPLIGAGTYADDRSAAVSATGSGEYFIRAVAAHQLAERVRLGGQSLQEALDAVLADIASARRQGRADRGRAGRRSGVGLHDAGDVSRHGRRDRPDRRGSIRTTRSGRASRAAATRPRSRSPARSASRKSATASRKPRFGMKCADRVTTGS